MSLAGTTGLIGTAVGLAVLVGVAGIAFKAVERGFGDGDRRRKKVSRRSSNNNIFDLGLTQNTPKRTRKKEI